jgi:hypothetical protein
VVQYRSYRQVWSELPWLISPQLLRGNHSPDWVLGNPTTKSITVSSRFYSGTCKGCNNPAGHWCSALTLWAVSQKGNILNNISLHSIQSIGCLEIVVHLIPSRMKGISRLMGLMKYPILQFLDVRHTNPSFVPQYSFVIFCKSGWLLFLGIKLYLLASLVFHLTFPCILEYCRIYFHLHDFYISDNPKVELVELLTQLEWSIISTFNWLKWDLWLQTSTTTFAFSGW